MTENPHSSDIALWFFDSDDEPPQPPQSPHNNDSNDDDDDEPPPPKKRRIKKWNKHEVKFTPDEKYPDDLLISDTFTTIMDNFLKSEFYKKAPEKLKKDKEMEFLSLDGKRILPQYEGELKKRYIDEIVNEEDYKKMRLSEKAAEAAVIDSMERAGKYYPEDLKYYDHSSLTDREIQEWTQLCQQYSMDRYRILEQLNEDKSLSTESETEMFIRHHLMFLDTYISLESELYSPDKPPILSASEQRDCELFSQHLTSVEYKYFCIHLGVCTSINVFRFQKFPKPGEIIDIDHSIALMINNSEDEHSITIFDSSHVYDGSNIQNLLFSLLLLSSLSGTEDGKASVYGIKNKMLAIFIINTLFGCRKPDDFFSLSETNPEKLKKDFEGIVETAHKKGWRFGEYRYKPQNLFPIEGNASIIFKDGYCGTYSAWFCWLCTVNPYNILTDDPVTDPPAQNIKAFAAYVRRCITYGRIAIPPRMLGYMKRIDPPEPIPSSESINPPTSNP